MPIMKISPEIVEEAERLHKEGWTFESLAKRYNVNSVTLRGRITKKERDLQSGIRITFTGKVHLDTLVKNMQIVQQAKSKFASIQKGQDIDYIVKRHSGNGNKIISRKGTGKVIAKDEFKFTILREGHHTPESFMYNDLVDHTIMVV